MEYARHGSTPTSSSEVVVTMSVKLVNAVGCRLDVVSAVGNETWSWMLDDENEDDVSHPQFSFCDKTVGRVSNVTFGMV